MRFSGTMLLKLLLIWGTCLCTFVASQVDLVANAENMLTGLMSGGKYMYSSTCGSYVDFHVPDRKVVGVLFSVCPVKQYDPSIK